jgi:hypothetical protein
MEKTLISVDLDWFNGSQNPIDELKNILQHIPKTVPAILTIEHHEFLPFLHGLVKDNKIPTPFKIVNYDEHHDYYHSQPSGDYGTTKITCANWGYNIPINWYDSYTWIYNTSSSCGAFVSWTSVQSWLSNREIKSSATTDHHIIELKSQIVAAIFCISPDYLSNNMFDYVEDLIEIIANHFKLSEIPVKTETAPVYDPRKWRMVNIQKFLCNA